MEVNRELGVIVSGERVHRCLMDSRLTAEDLEKARAELNETPEIRERLLQRFKEMLTDEEDFTPQTDDNYLLQFLRTRKFDLERSYKLMRDHYKFRSARPDLYPPSPSHIYDTLRRTDIFDYPPYRDHMGRAIYHVKFGNWDPDKVPYKDFMAAGIMLSDFMQVNPVTQINGVVGLWDFKGFGLKHFLATCSPTALWNMKALIQECQPGRYKGACIVNCHPLAAKAWNVLKTFLKEKFRRRVNAITRSWGLSRAPRTLRPLHPAPRVRGTHAEVGQPGRRQLPLRQRTVHKVHQELRIQDVREERDTTLYNDVRIIFHNSGRDPSKRRAFQLHSIY